MAHMTHILLLQPPKEYPFGWFVSCDHFCPHGYFNVDLAGDAKPSGPFVTREDSILRKDVAAVRLQESLVVVVRL